MLSKKKFLSLWIACVKRGRGFAAQPLFIALFTVRISFSIPSRFIFVMVYSSNFDFFKFDPPSFFFCRLWFFFILFGLHVIAYLGVKIYFGIEWHVHFTWNIFLEIVKNKIERTRIKNDIDEKWHSFFPCFLFKIRVNLHFNPSI